MKQAITILLALVAGGQASWDDPAVKVKWTLDLFSGFYSVPLTIDQAVLDGWIEAKKPDDIPDIYKQLVMYCYDCNSPICALYELYSRYIAGLQYGLNKENYEESAYNMSENGFKDWTWTCGGVTRTLHSIRAYFMSEEYLSKNATQLKLDYNKKSIVQDGVLVTEGPGGKLERAPIDVPQLEAENRYTKQQKIPMMGDHYYFNMSSTLECSAKTINPFFLLAHDQKVIGCAMMTFMKVKKQSGNRDWLEHPSQADVKNIVPRGPQCFYDLAKDPGAITIHAYFMNNPRLMIGI